MRLPQRFAYQFDRPEQPDEVWSQMMSYWSTTGQLTPSAVAPYQHELTGNDFQALAYQASGMDAPASGETVGDGSLQWADWSASGWEPADYQVDRDAGWRSEQGWHW